MGWFLRGPPLFCILTDLKSWKFAKDKKSAFILKYVASTVRNDRNLEDAF